MIFITPALVVLFVALVIVVDVALVFFPIVPLVIVLLFIVLGLILLIARERSSLMRLSRAMPVVPVVFVLPPERPTCLMEITDHGNLWSGVMFCLGYLDLEMCRTSPIHC
jgi:hypothetical protein